MDAAWWFRRLEVGGTMNPGAVGNCRRNPPGGLPLFHSCMDLGQGGRVCCARVARPLSPTLSPLVPRRARESHRGSPQISPEDGRRRFPPSFRVRAALLLRRGLANRQLRGAGRARQPHEGRRAGPALAARGQFAAAAGTHRQRVRRPRGLPAGIREPRAHHRGAAGTAAESTAAGRRRRPHRLAPGAPGRNGRQRPAEGDGTLGQRALPRRASGAS
jgi:hypothetical protein